MATRVTEVGSGLVIDYLGRTVVHHTAPPRGRTAGISVKEGRKKTTDGGKIALILRCRKQE